MPPSLRPRAAQPAGELLSTGVASVGLTSAIVNLVLKPLGGRRRPDRDTHQVPVARQVAMPRVHTGVHYPLDAVAGSVSGVALAPLAVAALERCRRRNGPGEAF